MNVNEGEEEEGRGRFRDLEDVINISMREFCELFRGERWTFMDDGRLLREMSLANFLRHNMNAFPVVDEDEERQQ
jgi:hypothetical protein